MTPEERAKHEYLGDGVYAEWDGYHITLRTGDHRDSHCDNKVFLDNSVINSFWKFCKKHLEKKSESNPI